MPKYADDTAIVGLVVEYYRNFVNEFVDWCDDNFLDFNVIKTKEMIIDFRRINKSVEHKPIVIKGQTVEIVHVYSYLGNVIDDELIWNQNTIEIILKRTAENVFYSES